MCLTPLILTTQVDEFMRGQLNAAVNNIVNKEDQSVTISGAGIQIGGDSNYQIRIVDNMIAMTDDGWQTSKLAIGLFATEQGKYWGVNADVIMGKLLAGSNLVLENVTKDGVMQFKADASGVWLNNSVFVLQSDGGGKMMIHPDYGFAAGTKDLFTVEDEEVKPIFINESGELVTDNDDFPKNANFYIDPKTGKAYFRGTVYATYGVFNGTVYATDGEFEGVVKADDFYLKDSNDSMKSILNDTKDKITADWLDLMGINVKNQDGNTVLRISEDGIMFGGSGNCQFAKSANGPWHYPMEDGDEYRHDFVRFGEKDTIIWGTSYKIVGKDGANGRPGSDANVTFSNILSALHTAENTQTTFITADAAGAPTIYGAKIYGAEIYAGGVNEKGGQVIGLTDEGIAIYNNKTSEQVLELGGINDDAYIRTGYNKLTISAHQLEISGGEIDLRYATKIHYGKNAPTAVFG